MKCLHLGDLHFGKTLSEFDLQADQEFIIRQILALAKEERVDVLLIAGDVYDRTVPSNGAMRLLNELLTGASALGLKTCLISGNHDSEEKLNFGRDFFAAGNVLIYSVFDGTLHREVLTDEFGEVDVYLLPFIKASQVRHFYPDAEIDTYEDAVRVVLEYADIDPSRRNILIAHQFVAGRSETETPKLGGSEAASVKAVGTVERIGYDLFDAFSYVALGHIHSPQRVGRESIRYCGSPLKYSLSEVEDTKSVPIVTIDNTGAVTIELKTLTPLRELRHIRGTKEQLLAAEHIIDPEDFIYVTLTDEEIVNDAMGIFQQYYPNTVKIDYENSHTHSIALSDPEEFAEQQSFPDLISSFYQKIYGCEISPEEMRVMNDVAKEAGIIDETD